MHIPVCKRGKPREEAVRRGALYPFELALQDQLGSARELPKHFRPASAEAWLSARLPQPQFQRRRRLGAGPVAAEPAICEWLGLGRRRFWKLLESARVAEVTPAARGWGVIKTSARPAAEGLTLSKETGARLAAPWPAGARVGRRRGASNPVGGRAREGLPGRRRLRWRPWAGAAVRRRGLQDCGPRGAPAVRSPKASARAELPQSACSQRVTTHGAAPPCLPKPHLRGQGLSTRILGCSSFPPSQIFSRCPAPSALKHTT
ncbi:uncharacterized protein LOC124240741 [Equus quagga]|uniref:uncharacterized protein LOC124240741 n=1 Tax=Equus quagga TaxID=89248 RepID=UPI001EE17694|nr:uncharacterized protein LOC124240741 [Equus quagga]